MELDCQRCGSKDKIKDGIVRGVQRYQCKKCNYKFTKERKGDEKKEIKRNALELYLEGLGFRSIGRILKVSHVSIYNWIKSFGEKIEEIRKTKRETEIVEIDEMHSYVRNKKNRSGFGLLLIELGESSSILSLGSEEVIQEKNFTKE